MGSTVGAGAGKKARAVGGRLQGQFPPGDTAAASAATCATVRARPSRPMRPHGKADPPSCTPNPGSQQRRGTAGRLGARCRRTLGRGLENSIYCSRLQRTSKPSAPGVGGAGGGQSPLAGQRRGPGRTPGTEPGTAQNSHRVCWIRGRSTGETPWAPGSRGRGSERGSCPHLLLRHPQTRRLLAGEGASLREGRAVPSEQHPGLLPDRRPEVGLAARVLSRALGQPRPEVRVRPGRATCGAGAQPAQRGRLLSRTALQSSAHECNRRPGGCSRICRL